MGSKETIVNSPIADRRLIRSVFKGELQQSAEGNFEDLSKEIVYAIRSQNEASLQGIVQSLDEIFSKLREDPLIFDTIYWTDLRYFLGLAHGLTMAARSALDRPSDGKLTSPMAPGADIL